MLGCRASSSPHQWRRRGALRRLEPAPGDLHGPRRLLVPRTVVAATHDPSQWDTLFDVDRAGTAGSRAAPSARAHAGPEGRVGVAVAPKCAVISAAAAGSGKDSFRASVDSGSWSGVAMDGPRPWRGLLACHGTIHRTMASRPSARARVRARFLRGPRGTCAATPGDRGAPSSRRRCTHGRLLFLRAGCCRSPRRRAHRAGAGPRLSVLERARSSRLGEQACKRASADLPPCAGNSARARLGRLRPATRPTALRAAIVANRARVGAAQPGRVSPSGHTIGPARRGAAAGPRRRAAGRPGAAASTRPVAAVVLAGRRADARRGGGAGRAHHVRGGS